MTLIRRILDRSLEAYFCVMLLVMIGVATWQVISRYALRDPSTYSEELLRFCLIWLSIGALAYAAGKSRHVTFTLLLDTLDARGRRTLLITVQALFIAFALLVMIFGGWRAVLIAAAQTSPTLGLSMGSVYAALPLSGVLCVIYCALNIADLIRQPTETAA
ncbi:MAG: TRAP transporter small permease [Rhodocyclaceae bacterium]